MLKNGVKLTDLFEKDNASEFRFEELDDGIRIIAYTGAKHYVIVPEEIDGKTVVEIGACNCYDSIGPIVYLPKTICRFNPESIEIENVHMWFSNAYMDENNPTFKVVDGVLYSADMTILYLCLDSGMPSYKMPDTVKIVKEGAFRTVSGNASWMGGLTIDNITFSSNLQVIEDYAFYNLDNGSSKKTVTLPESVKHIGMFAFNRRVEIIAPGWYETLGGIPGGIIRKEPFSGYSWDDKGIMLYSDDKKTLYGYMKKRSMTDEKNTEMDSLAFEAPTENISPYAFDNFVKLSKLDLGTSVKCIGEKAFDKAIIKTLRIPAQMEEIADDAFGFEKCNSVIVDKNNKHFMTDKIGFYRILEDGSKELIVCYKSSTEEYSILEGTVRICDQAFRWCETLKRLTLPSTLLQFDGECIRKTSVKSIHIPASVNALYNMANIDYTVDEANPIYFLEGEVLYHKNGESLIAEEGKRNAKNISIKEGTTEIAPRAFNANEALISVTMPSSLIKIGADAFHCGGYSGSTLKTITFGDHVEYIDDSAFASCQVKEVKLPSSLKYICSNAFTWSSVESFSISDNENYCTIDGVLLTADKKVIVAYPYGRKAKEYSIPEGVEYIGKALSGIEFSTLHIPNSVKVIGSEAFDEKVAEVFFGEGVLSLSEECLSKYEFSLKDKSFKLHGYPSTPLPELADWLKKKGSSVTLELFGMEEFASLSDDFEVMPEDGGVIITGFKTDTPNLVIPAEIGGYPVKAVSESAFMGKTFVSFTFISPETKIPFTAINGVQEYHLPEGLKEIPNYAFARSKATSIIIPKSVTKIGEKVFNWSAIEEVTIPGSVKVISKDMFNWAKRLRIVRLEEGVERIEDGAFFSCDSLKRVYIPSTVTYISERVFADGQFKTDYRSTIFVTVPGSYADQYLREKEYISFGNKYNLKVISASEAEFEDGAGVYNSFEAKLNDEGLVTAIIKDKIQTAEPDVIIPAEINGKEVSEIRFNGDYSVRHSIETLSIPKTVKKISGLTTKSFYAGRNETICFRSITVSEESPYFSSDGKALFSKDGKQLIHLFAYDLEEYIVPQGVETICADAFAYQTKLVKVNLPDSLTTIESAAFDSCQNLKEIVGAERVKNAAADAYNNTPYLEEQDFIVIDGVLKKYATEESEIIIPEGVIEIDADAFGSKQQTIRKVVLPTSILKTNGALNTLSVLETVIIQNGVEDISGWSLGQSRSLKEIIIPASVKKIGTVPSKYGKYTGLYVNERFIVDPNNTEYSDIDGVLYSKDLTILYRVPYLYNNPIFTVPDGVKQIESGAFSGNSTISEIKLPATVNSIGSAAFSDCSELAKISLSNISTICDSTFSGCSKLKKIKLPSTVESIGRNAFNGCSELVAINLEEVKEIGNSAFDGCRKLAKVELVCEKINAWSFQNCRSLKEVILSNTKEIGWSAFEGCAITSIDLPDTLQTIERSAFEGCQIKSVTVPKSVTEIGEKAFSGSSEIKIYDSLQSSPGEIGITDSYRHQAFARHTIVVLSKDSDEVKSVVPMYTDGTWDMDHLLKESWSEGAQFDFSKLDSYFTKIKDTDVKIQIALKRVLNPCDLLDANKAAYIAYISRNAKVIIKQFIDDEDIESCIAVQEYELIKKNNIDELISYATDHKATAFSAYLMDYKEKHIKATKTTKKETDSLSLGTVKTVAPWQISKSAESLLGRYRGNEIEVSFPTEVDGKQITGIANSDTKVPDNYKQLVSVIIPEGYKTIGQNAFYGCKNLEKIIIPASVEEIGDGAFANCSNLKEISLPNSVARIGAKCFKGCSNLVTIKLPIGIDRLENDTFNGCSMLARIDIPRTVRSINDKCFANSGITHVILHSRYIWIDSNAFEKGVAFRAYPGALEGKNIQIMTLADNPSDTMISVTIQFDNQAEKTLGIFAKETRKTFTKKSSKELTDKFSSFIAGDDLLNWISDMYGSTLTSTEEYLNDSSFIAEIKDFSDVSSIIVKEEKKNDDGDTTAVFTYDCATCSGDVKRSGKYATEKIIRYYKHFYTDDEEEFPTIDKSKNSTFVLTPVKSIEFKDKIFVLTGFSDEDTQTYTKIINDKGGIVKSSVVLATDYLLVNEEYGSETTKYKKAIELNESDHHIAIINSRMLIKYAKA